MKVLTSGEGKSVIYFILNYKLMDALQSQHIQTLDEDYTLVI